MPPSQGGPSTYPMPPSQGGPSTYPMPPSLGGKSPYPMPPSQGGPSTYPMPPFQGGPTMSANISFEQQLHQYLQKNKTKLYILTPCFASLCYVNYVHCLMSTIELFRRFNIQLKVEFCKNDSLVSRARNNLVARAMNNPKMTHVIFIDNDISWSPVDIIKLLLSDKQLIGGIYPLKNYDWNDLIVDKNDHNNTNVIKSWIDKKNQSQFKDFISDQDIIQQKLLKYNVNYLNTTIQIKNNVAEVRHLATGFMMFKRDVIEKMSAAFPSTKYTDDINFLTQEENKYAYALFDCGVLYDHYMSEDWMFCERWNKMGGSIFIDVSISLNHTGSETYKGCYMASLI
jgi:hypothetical protein